MSAQNNNLDKIEHIVVLMMENRSFDNVLGWLYPDNPDFRGVNSAMSNPRPDGSLAYVGKETNFIAPFPDPNEPYENMYSQMFSQPPTMPIPNVTIEPTMQGYVIDYANAISIANADNQKHGKPPFDLDPGIIMNCFTPETLPVINGLARSYAVCDNWFSSVPTQTFPNRSFIHAATSSGNVYNTWKTGEHIWDVGIFINKTKTIYNLLEENGVSWKIYHGGSIVLCNALINQEKIREFVLTGKHIFPYQNFLTDLQTPGALPAYTFIEPNMICSSKYGPENDMHPAYADFVHGPPTDVRNGDKLIYDIYTALRSSDYWEKTLLVITFDEGGGCFDHIPTPLTPTLAPDDVVIPYTDGTNGGSNFDFKRLGARVPSVLISPWIEAGTICHTQFDHTSVIKTASNKWLNGQNLTRRDLAATDLSEMLSLSTPRTDTPEITPLPLPEFSGCAEQILSPLHTDLLASAAHFLAHETTQLVDLSALKTKEEVVTKLDQMWESFAGK